MIWLRELEPLRVWPKMIPAAHYNSVRLALRRLGCPLRHQLERPALILLLHEDVWAGMAPWDENLPLLAWTGFDTRRSALDQPVACRLHLYHAHAGLLMGVALEALDAGLKVRLAAHRAGITEDRY